MGLVTAPITLRNPLDDRLATYEPKALFDTGALLLCIPVHVATQLQLPETQTRDITTADRRRHLCPYVGPIEIAFKNRVCFQGALVRRDDALLGAVPMQDRDSVILPSRETSDVNPESPNLPMAIVK